MPPNGLLMRFVRMVRPTLPALSVAPMSATERGAKKARKLRRSADAGRSVNVAGGTLAWIDAGEPTDSVRRNLS